MYSWLRKDDVLCWWGEQSALVFQDVIGNLLHRSVDYPMRVIYTAWQMNTTDGHLKSGSPYRLARDRGIQVPEVEHYSANDVDTIRALLHGTFTPPSAVSCSLISPAVKPMKQADYRKKKERASAKNLSRYKLLYDTRSKLLHTVDCPDMGNMNDMQGFETYKSCIQNGLKPCRCCRDEYWKENWRLSKEIIRKCGYSYITQWEERLFHRTTCVHVKRIPFMDLRGAIYFDSCLENKFQPCRFCKPTKKQQIDPQHIYHLFPNKEVNAQQKDTGWITTRKLTWDEKQALIRHEVAQKERAAIENDRRPKTLIERQDEHTLTQTGYAFWAAIGYQTFHLRNCTKLEHISGLRGFAKYHDAVRAGLTPCKLCKPSTKYDITKSVPIYQKERPGESTKTLDRLCDTYGYKHYSEETDYHIETAVGKWMLDTRTHPVDVYHINLVTSPDANLYHRQHRLFLSFADTFEYIRRHDSSLIAKMKAKVVTVDAENQQKSGNE